MGGASCQRCFLLTHHRRHLSLPLPPDQYGALARRLRPLRALLLLTVDVLDLPDSVPDLAPLLGPDNRLVAVGNKVDLVPADSPDYLRRLRLRLQRRCLEAGAGRHLEDVRLISAKTGYGVERLVSSLQRSWGYRGDVYLLGGANAGKSTLFNALLQSDYCQADAPHAVAKATVSPWPGKDGGQGVRG